jgi:hypothetical protein
LAFIMSKRKPPRRSRPLIVGRTSLSHDPAVVEWVRERILDGQTREEIVGASKRGTNGWPVPGRALTNGGFTEVRAALAALEHLENGAAQPKRRGERAGRRIHQLAEQRRAGRGGDLFDLQEKLVKMTRELGYYSRGDIEAELDEDGVTAETVSEVFDDLSDLETKVSILRSFAQTRLDDAQVLTKVFALRKTTGCTEPEKQARLAAADRLQRRLNNRLNP